MSFSKAHLFDSLPYYQSIWSKALSHPARITILNHLLENGSTPFYELSKLVPLSSTTTSQHIRHLRILGLIEAEEKTPHTFYQLIPGTCKNLAFMITDLNLGFSGMKSSGEDI